MVGPGDRGASGASANDELVDSLVAATKGVSGVRRGGRAVTFDVGAHLRVRVRRRDVEVWLRGARWRVPSGADRVESLAKMLGHLAAAAGQMTRGALVARALFWTARSDVDARFGAGQARATRAALVLSFAESNWTGPHTLRSDAIRVASFPWAMFPVDASARWAVGSRLSDALAALEESRERRCENCGRHVAPHSMFDGAICSGCAEQRGIRH